MYVWHSPDELISCPLCDAAARKPTLLSGNDFDAVFWSDGRRVAPSLPLPTPVASCHACNRCFWLDDAAVRPDDPDPPLPWWRLVFRPDRRRPLTEWDDAPEVQEPDEAGYLQALARGWTVGEEQERSLRVLVWWRGNDRFRPDPYGHAPLDVPAIPDSDADAAPWLDDARRANMVALMALLDQSAEDRLMRTELLRQLDRQDGAIGVLDTLEADTYPEFVALLRRLCADTEATIGAIARR